MRDKYGVEQDRYCYPDSSVLINLLNIEDASTLEAAELELTQFRISELVPDFDTFSLDTLRRIHGFLFQDLYQWAGEVRTVDISKGTTRFANVRFIESEAHKLFRQLQKEDFLIHLPMPQFINRFAHYYSELNVIHPFRDGNGRAQRILFESLAINAGYEIRWQSIQNDEWLEANIAAYHCDLTPLEKLLARVLTKISDAP
jgi:cell filamentation protein